MNNFFDSKQFRQDIQDSRSSLPMDKNILEDKNKHFSYDNFDSVPVGRFTVFRDDVRMEALYIPDEDSDLLFVVLHGARAVHGKLVDVPKFDMWSWQKKLKINYLSIEDPMYFSYSDPVLRTGWYYGNEKIDYREYVSDLLLRICNILGFPHDKVILYGLSAGGTAAGFIANRFDGCTAIMHNPQINFRDYKYSEEFTKITGLDIISESINGKRNDLIGKIKNDNKNLFFFMFNGFSAGDIDYHFTELVNRYSYKPNEGLNKLSDNVYAWVYAAEGWPSPHTTTPPAPLLEMIISSVIQLKNGSNLETMYKHFLRMNDLYYEYSLLYRANYENKQKNTSNTEFTGLLGHKLLNLYNTARLDIKNIGNNCDLIIDNISDNKAQIVTPDWFSHNGKGYCVKSRQGNIAFTIKCINKGKLQISLRCNDIRDKDGQRIPIYLDYTNLTINGKDVFSERKSISHDETFKFIKNVEDGETVTLSTSWEPCDIRKL